MRIDCKILIMMLVAVIASSCGDRGKFSIEGTVAGGRTMNMRVVYAGEDNVNNVLTAARDGKFEFTGYAPSDRGVLVEILDNDYRVMGRLYAEDGDKLKVTVDAEDRTKQKAEGNDLTERWTEWLHQNAAVLKGRNARAVNEAVAKYVKAHPDDMLSGVLMATEYDASIDGAGAEKLLTSLDPEARPAWMIDGRLLTESRLSAKMLENRITAMTYIDRRDSIVTFKPKGHRRSLLVFTGEETGRGDSIVKKLKEFRETHKGVEMIDFWLETDTFTWRRMLRSDSVDWKSGWAAGSVAAPALERLAIPRLPFFVVTDSAGRQLYRGGSVTLAVKKASE